jgi:hypothetical protein
MTETRFYPRTLDALREIVTEATQSASCVVMQAGHFLLHYDAASKSIVPCIADELAGPQHAAISREFGQFPIMSWRLGLRLLNRLPATERYVMIVVNDWQYLPEGVDRSEFYRQYGRLPNCYRDELAAYLGRIALLEPNRVKTGVSTNPFFGEMNLRNRYHRHVGRMIKSSRLPTNTAVVKSGETIYCNLIDNAGSEREVYCSDKTGDCSAEIAEMLHLSYQQRKCNCFINIYPLVCQGFVEYGTSLSETLLGSGIRTVLNIGVPSSHVASEDDLIENCQCTLHHAQAPLEARNTEGGKTTESP